jgi:hypothetical protein
MGWRETDGERGIEARQRSKTERGGEETRPALGSGRARGRRRRSTPVECIDGSALGRSGEVREDGEGWRHREVVSAEVRGDLRRLRAQGRIQMK